MIIECLAIIAVLGATIFAYLRIGKKVYASIVAVLLLLPGVHCLIELIFRRHLVAMDPQRGIVLWILADVLTMGLSCVLIGWLARKVEKRSQRISLIVITGIYIAVLTVVLLFEIVGQFGNAFISA